jgi:hypothetical protein
MRIWDVAPGYLNRQSLLGEHRELHGIVSIHLHGKRGYANHSETRRWAGFLGALAVRQGWLVAEMTLRGYDHHSPLPVAPNPERRPVYLDTPPEQLALLAAKYRGKPQGRIPLPQSSEQLWAQHKYAILARDPEAYAALGRRVAGRDSPERLATVATELTDWLRQSPSWDGVLNAIEHMWGHVKGHASPEQRAAAARDPRAMLAVTQALAREHDPSLWHSVALSEMGFWMEYYSSLFASSQG